MEKELINHADAARLIQADPRTLARIVSEREIQFIRKGREKLYAVIDIEKLKGVTPDVDIKIYAVVSPKGGTGKTTTVKYISYMLAQKGNRVLVADADPQHYYTAWATNYLEDETIRRLKDCNMLSLLKNDKKLIKCAIPLFDNLDFVAGLRKLEHYDRELSTQVGRELLLKTALAPALPRYDYIIIDSSPAQSPITIAALLASNAVIIPIMPDIDSFEAARDMIKTISALRQSALKDRFILQEINVLPVKQRKGFFKAKLSDAIMSDINSQFNGDTFQDIDINILDPVYEYDCIPLENYQGKFNDTTAAYKNYETALQEVFNYE